MTLIVIFVALLCERLLSHLRRWRAYDWFGRYLTRLQQTGLFELGWESAWGLLFLLPPLVAVAALQWLLQGGLLTLLGLAFSLAVLVFTLGPRDLWEQVHALIAARAEGRLEQASAIESDLLTVTGWPTRQPIVGDVLRAVMVQGHERLFGVLLWFFVLGPLGAVAYRMIAHLPRQLRVLHAGPGLVDAAIRLHALAAWVPVRLVALLYFFAGSADGALAGWRAAQAMPDQNWARHGWLLLAETGTGALHLELGGQPDPTALDAEPHLRQALALLSRSLIILLAGLSALTVAGWIV